MNADTKSYKEMASLANEAYSLVRYYDPHDMTGSSPAMTEEQAFAALQKLLSDVATLIGSLKDVNAIDDSEAATWLLSADNDDDEYYDYNTTNKRYAIARMYGLKLLCEEFGKALKPIKMERYRNLVFELYIDVVDIFNVYTRLRWDKGIRDQYVPIENRMGKRRSLIINDHREVVRTMLWIDSIDSIDKLSVRDVRPHVQIIIRQAIEAFLKEVVGIRMIVDMHGNMLKKHTQVAKKFIVAHRDKSCPTGCGVKGDGWSLCLRIPVKTMERLNDWCNNFTHQPKIASLSKIHFAYDQYEKLVEGSISDPLVRIANPAAMRAEFQQFMAEEDPEARLVWLNGPEDLRPTEKMRREKLKKHVRKMSKDLWRKRRALWRLRLNPFIRYIKSFNSKKGK